MFIVLEGIDGVGKTTTLTEIQKLLPTSITLRTPGFRYHVIRDLVLNPEYAWDNKARLMFFFGEMIDICNNVIKPKTATEIIIADRFYLSTYIYQVEMNKHLFTSFELNLINSMFNTFMSQIDTTIILSTDLKTSKERSSVRNQEFSGKDVFEGSSDESWLRRKSMYDKAEELGIASLLGQVLRYDTTNITPGDLAFNIVVDIDACANFMCVPGWKPFSTN